MQQGCTLEMRLGTTLKCDNLTTCIEWPIADYGTVHPVVQGTKWSGLCIGATPLQAKRKENPYKENKCHGH